MKIQYTGETDPSFALTRGHYYEVLEETQTRISIINNRGHFLSLDKADIEYLHKETVKPVFQEEPDDSIGVILPKRKETSVANIEDVSKVTLCPACIDDYPLLKLDHKVKGMCVICGSTASYSIAVIY